jgi:hypothetical protein
MRKHTADAKDFAGIVAIPSTHSKIALPSLPKMRGNILLMHVLRMLVPSLNSPLHHMLLSSPPLLLPKPIPVLPREITMPRISSDKDSRAAGRLFDCFVARSV